MKKEVRVIDRDQLNGDPMPPNLFEPLFVIKPGLHCFSFLFMRIKLSTTGVGPWIGIWDGLVVLYVVKRADWSEVNYQGNKFMKFIAV